MVRIIPWKLPDVEGGSVGGYTPAPTPVTPSNDPYDFANLVFTPEFEFVWLYNQPSQYIIYKYAECKITMSGVTILNSVEVAQVVAEIGVSSGTVTGTKYDETTDSTTIDDQTLEVDITSLMTPSGGVITASEHSGKEATSSSVKALRQLSTYIVMEKDGVDAGLNSGSQPTKDSTYPTIDSNTSTLTLQKITVYNANGVALQEYTPGE